LWGSSLGGNQGAETIFGFLFIWVAVTMNILSLRYMKWVPNLGAILRIALLGFFAILVVIAGLKNGFHGGLGGFFPTDMTVFIGVLGVLVFQWIGFELQTNASEEMDNPQRDVPRAIYASGLISFLGYGIPILGVVLILASNQLSNVSGFVAAYQFGSQTVFGGAAPFFNHLAAVAFVFVLLSSGTTWLMGSDRLMAIGALAGSGPQQLGYFSTRFGTPIVVNVLSGVIATIFMFITFFVTGGGLHGYFAAVLGLVISTTTFSYILIFPALLALRRKYPNVKRPFVVPGGEAGAWVSVILCMFWVVAATIFSLWPGLLTSTWSADTAGVSRTTFEVYTFITVGVLAVLAVVFWAVGRGHAVHTEPMGATAMPSPAPGGE
jgi:amino acid transporter